MTEGLDVYDYVLLVVSMALCALIGLYFSNKNKNMEAYMLGDRSLGIIPVAISLMTSCMSALSLLGSSAELYYQGPSYAFIVFAMILCGPITAYTVLPVFYQMNELSLYKYLELRFGHTVKYIISFIFVFQMLFYNAVVLYVPAMCLEAVIGIERVYSILLIGLMCVLYSGIGGLKAVVWTDFYQAMLMYFSIIVVGALGTYDAGGFSNIFKTASEGQRLNLDGLFNIDLTTRHTLWGVLVGSTIKHVYLVGVNQVQMQRALSLPSLRHSQICFLFCGLFTALISALSSYMGLVLYSAYKGCDPYLSGDIPRRDAVIVHYVARRLSKIIGLRGIFVAGVFSATLSTLSSFANSMAALAIEDYIKPVRKYFNYQEIENPTKLAKILATFFGLICVLSAYVIEKANSRLLQATTTMFGAVGVPFLAAFALGIFTKFTNTIGIVVSLIVTVSLGVYITIIGTFFSSELEPKMPIYFDDKCAAAFNETINFSDLDPQITLDIRPEIQLPFSIERISYMSLPAVQFVLTIFIATLVSILTGGLSQDIPDQYLVGFLHRKKEEECLDRGDENHRASYILEHVSALSGLHNDKKASLSDSSNGDRKRKIGVINKGFDTSSLGG